MALPRHAPCRAHQKKAGPSLNRPFLHLIYSY
jgi:hypothetical protein